MVPFSALNAIPYLMEYQEKSPLVHCMTNDVVQNFTANLLLATGGSPAMIPDIEECAEFTEVASALLINVGTLTKIQAEAMLHSATFSGLVIHLINVQAAFSFSGVSPLKM